MGWKDPRSYLTVYIFQETANDLSNLSLRSPKVTTPSTRHTRKSKGGDFISKLADVNSAFGEYIAALKYECECATTLNEWLLKRTEIQIGRNWPGEWENEITEFVCVVPKNAKGV